MEPDWTALGEAVRVRREDANLTQEQAAAKADISSSTWRIVETASRTNVRRPTLRAICRALNWTSDSYELILEGKAPRQAGSDVSISGSEAESGIDVEGLPPEDVEMIRSVVRNARKARGLDV